MKLDFKDLADRANKYSGERYSCQKERYTPGDVKIILISTFGKEIEEQYKRNESVIQKSVSDYLRDNLMEVERVAIA